MSGLLTAAQIQLFGGHEEKIAQLWDEVAQMESGKFTLHSRSAETNYKFVDVTADAIRRCKAEISEYQRIFSMFGYSPKKG
jgi:hypothetical protein